MANYFLKIELYNPKNNPPVFTEDLPLSELEKIIIGKGIKTDSIKVFHLPLMGKISLPFEALDSVKKQYKDRREILKIETIVTDLKFFDEEYLAVNLSLLNKFGIIEINPNPVLALPSENGSFLTEIYETNILNSEGKQKKIYVPTRDKYRRLKPGQSAEYVLMGRSEARMIARISFYDNAKISLYDNVKKVK